MMKLPALAIGVLLLALAEPAVAKDDKGRYTALDLRSCGDYTKVYAKTSLKGTSYDGPTEAIFEFEWISGWISSYNATHSNGLKDIRRGMSTNDLYRWIASYCRDNPRKHLGNALEAYVKAQLK